MGRFVNPAQQLFDDKGAVLSGGLLYFFETNTNTLKDTFGDAALTIQNPNPIVLDAAGRVGEVWLDGSYKVVCEDRNGVQIWERDPVGDVVSGDNGQDWDATLTYDFNDLVQGSDDLYYTSIINGNIGNDPTVQPSAVWSEVIWLRPWLTANTYRIGEPTIGSDGRLYESVVGGNQGNDPTTDDGTFWRLLVTEFDTPTLNGLTIDKTDAAVANITFQTDGLTTDWELEFDASENLTLKRYVGGVFQDDPVTFDNAAGVSRFLEQVEVQEDFTLNREGDAFPARIFLNSDAGQANLVRYQDAGVDRWQLAQDTGNQFVLTRYDGGGLQIDDPWLIQTDGTMVIENNLRINLGDLELDATSPTILASDVATENLNIDFNNNATDVTLDIFKTTNTPGDAKVEIHQANGTDDPAIEMDSTGWIWPARHEASVGEGGVKIRRFTLSTNAPSGGSDGDVWMRYV